MFGEYGSKLAKNSILLMFFLLLSAAYLVNASSIKGVGVHPWDYDTRSWYTAGTCWLNGDSPYDKALFAQTWDALFEVKLRDQATFVYPPTMAIISVPLALMPWSLAPWVYRAVGMLAILGVAGLTWLLMAPRSREENSFVTLGWYIVLCGSLRPVVQVLVQGQCASIVVFGCLLAWYGWQKRLLGWFLVGFLLASIKPQISLLPLGYILCAGGFRWFAAGVFLSAVFSIVMLTLVPISNLFGYYQESLEGHLQHQEFNQWQNYCGAPALLGNTPLGKHVMILGVVVGILATCWIGWRARQTSDDLSRTLRHQQLVWVMAMTLMPIHIYDLVGQVFVTMTLWVIPRWERRVLAFALIFLGDQSGRIASIVVRLGEGMEPLGNLIHVQGISMAGFLLLGLFFYWYWSDFLRSKNSIYVSRPTSG